jgi:hypothetical protein
VVGTGSTVPTLEVWLEAIPAVGPKCRYSRHRCGASAEPPALRSLLPERLGSEDPASIGALSHTLWIVLRTAIAALALVLLAGCGSSDRGDAVEVFPSCNPPPKSCEPLLVDTFDRPSPGAAPAAAGPLTLASGERTGKVFLRVYNGEFGADERVVPQA